MSRWPEVDFDDSEDEDFEEEFLSQKCRRFRILVMGKAGVGKSTLLSMVFNVPAGLVGVRHQGEGKGRHIVWDGKISRNNPLLVIHDSGGFDTAETYNLEEVKRFIDDRAARKDLEEQLHCIWYCIDCNDPRFWSEAESKFRSLFQNTSVPVLFVLTKFDIVVGQFLAKRFMESGTPIVDKPSLLRFAVTDATIRVRENIQKPLEKEIGRGIRTQILSNDDPKLVKQLVLETTKLVKPNLKQLWIGVQQIIAFDKRKGATMGSVEAISTKHARIGMLLPVPLMKTMTHLDIFSRMYHTVRQQWNIFDLGLLEQEQTVSKLRQVCQEGAFFSLGRVLDPLGVLTGPYYVREYLRWAVDLNLAFELLFWKLKEPGRMRQPSSNGNQSGERCLEMNEIEAVLEEYEASEERLNAHKYIVKRVEIQDLGIAFKRQVLCDVLETAIDTAVEQGRTGNFWKLRRSPRNSTTSISSFARHS